MLSETEYLERASSELAHLVGALDALGERIDPEFSGDIITLEFADGDRFVINSHRAARQIWMAARRHAWHFDFDAATGKWCSSKEGAELWQTISEQLSDQLGEAIRLSR